MTQESIATKKRPGFLKRFFIALTKTTFMFILLAGLSVAGWFGFMELRRSFDVVSGRVDDHAEQLYRLQIQVDGQADELAAMQPILTNQDEDLEALQTALDALIVQQDGDVAAATEQINSLFSSTEGISVTVSVLADGQTALQQDVIAHSSELDTLGGELDGMRGELTAVKTNETILSESVAAFEAELTAAGPANLRQAVLVFRLWEMVTRAQMRLAEQNLGLAAADVDTALLILPDLMAGSSEETAVSLQTIESRLQMAAGNLPNNAETAVNDLNIVWQELDTILASLLGLEQNSANDIIEVTPDAMLTPTPEATPSPTPAS